MQPDDTTQSLGHSRTDREFRQPAERATGIAVITASFGERCLVLTTTTFAVSDRADPVTGR
jgi:hypothetical protein